MARNSVPLAGVIGDPIGHSLSPKLHGHWLKTYGVPGHYIPMRVQHADLEAVLETLPKAGFVGVNVTIPHKETVLRLADKVTDRAALIGAANTLTFAADGSLHADNTDGLGFLASIRQTLTYWTAQSGPSVVLGAGGAAKAIVSALLSDGAPEVHVVNRTVAKAQVLLEQFGARIRIHDWTQVNALLRDAALVVNTTSLGMEGQPPLELDFAALSPPTVVTDIVYAPLKTTLLAAAEAQGCEIVDGLGMLLHQAVPGFERWFSYTPIVDDALRDAVLGA